MSPEQMEQILDGSVRTFFVFTDLPYHYEWRVSDMPLVQEGFEMDMDMRLRSPENPRLSKDVSGTYRVTAVRRTYSTKKPSKAGLSQYLELSPVPVGATSRQKAGQDGAL